MQKFNEYMKNKLVFSYEISRACNLRCTYCYALNFLDNTKTHDPIIADLVIQKLTEFKQENPHIELELDLLGGDPLMAPNLIEFVTELSKIDIVIWVVTNLTIKNKKRIDEVGQLLKLPNVGIAATWHDNIDDEIFKNNILYLKKYIKDTDFGIKEKWVKSNFSVSFVLFNENPNMMKKVKWLQENNIYFGLTHLYNNQERAQSYLNFNDETKFVFHNSLKDDYRYYLDNTQLTPQEFEELELYKIPEKYRTVCEPLNFNISYFGDITLSCQMKNKERHRYHIKDGIKHLRTFCNGGDCYCSSIGYKELHGRKNDN